MKRTKVTFNKERLQVSIELVRALAHPLRLKILEFIDNQGTTHVNSIYNSIKIEQSITSQHLRIMRKAGVLEAEREGKFVFYSINYEIVKRIASAVKNFVNNSGDL